MTHICCPFDRISTIGGVTLGGSAAVDVPSHTYDGMICVLPLDETSDGTVHEFIDRTGNGLHGTGGVILTEGEDVDIDSLPIIDYGVFCRPSQYFAGRQSIWIEPDGLPPDSQFTVSLWAKYNSTYKTRCYYSRGFDDLTTGEKYVLSIGHSFLNTLAVSVNQVQSNGTISEKLVFGSTTLTKDTWHHAALTYDGTTLRLYVNGVLGGSATLTGTLAGATNESYLGQLNGAQQLEGNMQELHIFAECKPASYLKAEYDAFCGDFVSVGDEVPLYYW